MRLAYFTAKWCGPCRQFGPLLEREAEARGLPVDKIDIDENTELTMRFQIISVPTVIAVEAGEVADRFGFMRPLELRQRLDALA